MKRTVSMLVAVLAVACVTVPVFGQDEANRGNRGGRLGRGQRPGGPGTEAPGSMQPGGRGGLIPFGPIVEALDTDGDRTLSANEIQNASKSLLKLDRNGDGRINPEELRPFPGEGPRGGRRGEARDGVGPRGALPPAAMFQQRDSNRNGKLEGDEIPERMQRLLPQIDTNGDAAIDRAELEKSRDLLGDRGGRRGMQDLPGREGGAGVIPKRPGQ